MIKKIWAFIEQYLTRKIGAEIKCCLTFFLILCFYCIYRLLSGFTDAVILHMLEMVLLAYVLEWIQLLMHSDFDEVDRLGIKEWLVVLVGSSIYALVGHFGNWFEQSIGAGVCFFLYMACAYLCTFLVYKIKRVIDAKHLNDDLKQFQKRRTEDTE